MNGAIIPNIDSSKMKPNYIGSFTTIATMQTALDTFVTNIAENDAIDIYFECTAGTYYDSSAGGLFYGRLFKVTNTQYFITGINPKSSNILPKLIWRWTNGWVTKTVNYTT